MFPKNNVSYSILVLLIGLIASSFSFAPTATRRHSQPIELHSTASDETSTSLNKQQVVVKKPQLSRTVIGPPLETKPDYENIHGPLGPLADKVFMIVFRNQMAKKVGIDSKLPKDNYMGLMELTAAMNARYSDRRQVQTIAQDVLRKCG